MYSIIYITNKESAVHCCSLTKESMPNGIANMYSTFKKAYKEDFTEGKSTRLFVRSTNQNIKTLLASNKFTVLKKNPVSFCLRIFQLYLSGYSC